MGRVRGDRAVRAGGGRIDPARFMGRTVREALGSRVAEVYEKQGNREKADFEYYIRVDTERGKPAYFPATAPRLNQTVVRY